MSKLGYLMNSDLYRSQAEIKNENLAEPSECCWIPLQVNNSAEVHQILAD